MKMLSLTLCIFLVVGSSQAMPQYGQPIAGTNPSAPQTSRNPAKAPSDDSSQQKLPEGCRIQYKNINTIVEIETENEVCTPYTDQVCDTKYRQACSPHEDTECRTVNKKVCETKNKEVCTDLVRDVPENYVEDECNDELKKVCDSTWVIKENGDKVWEEDPTTCKQIPETKCQQVKKTRTRKEPYTACNNVPYEECKDVPEQECRKVTKEKCERQAYQDCRDVEKQNCETVHKKSPQNQTERKAVQICDGKVIDAVPFLGTRSGQTNSDSAINETEPRDGLDNNDEHANDQHTDMAFVFSN